MENQHDESRDCSTRAAALKALGLNEEEYRQLRVEGRLIRRQLSKRLDPIAHITARDMAAMLR